MSRFEKLFERFCRQPNDFSYDELISLLKGFGYAEDNRGKTSGSRIAFVQRKTKHIIRLHKPHPGTILKRYQMAFIYAELKSQGVIK